MSSAHPGLPGQQKQLEHTIQALRQARQQQVAGSLGAQPGIQQQARVPPQHGGMLAWQEVGPGGLTVQQVKQVKQLQRERQLSSAYGSNPLGDKVRLHQVTGVTDAAAAQSNSSRLNLFWVLLGTKAVQSLGVDGLVLAWQRLLPSVLICYACVPASRLCYLLMLPLPAAGQAEEAQPAEQVCLSWSECGAQLC